MVMVEPIRKKEDIRKIEKILKRQSLRNLVLFKMGINCGLRISDILALNVSDVRDKDIFCLVEQKTGKLRKIPINGLLKKILKTYTQNKHNSDPLFTSFKTHQRLDRFTAYKIIVKACKKAKLSENIGTHTLRKTFGYHYYKKYKDVAMLQKIFNHSSPNITLRYIGITEDEIYDSYSNFSL